MAFGLLDSVNFNWFCISSYQSNSAAPHRIRRESMNIGNWSKRRELGEAIKRLLFDTNIVDPRSYNKSIAIAAKRHDKTFSSIEDGVWLTSFKRAASEYSLKLDHDEVEARHAQKEKSVKNKSTKTTTKVSRCADLCKNPK
jgi:adenylate kinase family enzyme